MTQQPQSHPQQSQQTGEGARGQQPPPVWDEAHRPSGPTPGTTGWAGPVPGATPWQTGGLVFAGVLMMVNGVVAVLQGISAIATDDVYERINDYVYKISLTGWGVILLCLGAVALVVGWGILQGAWWARITGIFLASLSLVANFLFLPYQPVWSVLMVALDFFVIWALATAPDREKKTRAKTS
ncbi:MULTISPECIES: hypothetical protein [Streptomyces]|uniref:DUF7144 domain-containing protein n=1 Tax=Streptomyces fuscus TaxID=3048495 RepID=A0ABT7J1C1_9ACTN|nr:MULTISPECIES: hypothetical protein [Streptomyces]MCM1971653.1 hypothetical protein [Streptomyces sp. G1]MDL2078655.1 hypothetical protein [Streptomyces fuscus]SBT90078.1 hypothetical protein GA0115233_101530 [Streptomyces sp. DI166]